MSNPVYLTTKVHPGNLYLRALQARVALSKVPIAIFVSLPPIRDAYESVPFGTRVALLRALGELGLPSYWYLRPLVEEWFDEGRLRKLAATLLPVVQDRVILSSVVMSPEIAGALEARGLDVPPWDPSKASHKIEISPDFVRKVRRILEEEAARTAVNLGPVRQHRYCGLVALDMQAVEPTMTRCQGHCSPRLCACANYYSSQ
jgi:hypothetical protein